MKYIFIALVLLSCNNIVERRNAPKLAVEVLDTIGTVPAIVVAKPALFETAFIKGTTEKGKSANINLYGITIGKINVTSGQIIACDPLHIDEYGLPFTQLFPVGEFPVQLSIAKVAQEETVAFARINFSDEPVVRWQLALLKDQKPMPVGSDEPHGFGVDAGIGIYMDQSAIKAMTQEQLTEIEEGISKDILKEMEKHYHYDWKYAMYNVGQSKLAAFTTGLGDGRYATYIGFDAKGNPCRLIADFGLFDWKQKL